MRTTSRRLRVLAVDDLPSALDDLCRLLRESPMIENVTAAGDPLTALKLIQNERYDAVLLDISMPGLDGLELANLLAKLGDPPAIVFVTAHDRHAVAAFGIGAADYLLKPVRAERLSATLARVLKFLPEEPDAPRSAAIADVLAALPVDSGGRTVYVRRSEVHFVEAQGDYVKLHTVGGVHLYRMPISRLEEYWEPACEPIADIWSLSARSGNCAPIRVGCSRIPRSATSRSAAGWRANCGSGCWTWRARAKRDRVERRPQGDRDEPADQARPCSPTPPQSSAGAISGGHRYLEGVAQLSIPASPRDRHRPRADGDPGRVAGRTGSVAPAGSVAAGRHPAVLAGPGGAALPAAGGGGCVWHLRRAEAIESPREDSG
ncbi:LytR/AlgR family response regulator transcription factor [Nocardia jiangxiensis]|uniref:LytR/AlgR family response regulator transcription factor n=1 Tax=Nocardia jiangxiensis TaxID=282685 RepID=UPI0003124F9F